MGSTESEATGSKCAKAVVSAADLTREYTRGGTRVAGTAAAGVIALDGVSLSIERGEVVGIAGPSGSGKSTLLHLLAGLDTPTAGTVRLGETDVASLNSKKRARRRLEYVGIVFQRFHLLSAISARANVALPLVEVGVGKATRRERATARLDAVGLGDRATHRPGQLSGGEQQRVAIARAIVTEPELVVADEPTGELDSETSARVLSLLREIADDRAVVLASHDQQALDSCDRVVHLRDGQISERT